METSGKTLAITAETLYLLNLLLAPGVGFAILLVVYLRNRKRAEPLAANHLSQTVGVSLMGGALIIVITTVVMLLGGVESGYTWMVVILYFTVIHSSLILMGVIGLVKAMSGEHYRYPVIGRPFLA